MQPTGRHPGGFTLLELLVVLMVASLIFSLVLPQFSGAVPGARLKGAARDLAVALRQARNQAITRNTGTGLRLDLERRQYLLDGERPTVLPEGVRITVPSADAGIESTSGQHTVHFFADGSSTGGEIVLSRGERGYRLDVDWLTGRIGIAEVAIDAP